MKPSLPLIVAAVGVVACGDDGESGPDTSASDVVSDTTQSDVVGDTTQSDVTHTDTLVDDTTHSDTAATDTVVGDTVVADTAVTDTGSDVAGDTSRPMPTEPTAFSSRTLAAYGATACAVVDGAVACWGDNRWGELGVAGEPTLPVAIDGIEDAVTVAVADTAACAVHADGTVSCWGSDEANTLGPLATGSTSARMTATAMPGITDAREIVGNWRNFCVRRATGVVTCWGDDDYGVLPISEPEYEGLVDIEGIVGAIQLAVYDWGRVGFCALRADGGVSCWGGLGSLRDMGLSEVRQLAGVGNGMCARVGADWRCWGADVRDAATGAARALDTPSLVADYAAFDVLGGACDFVALNEVPTSVATVCGVDAQTSTFTCAGQALLDVTSTSVSLTANFVELTSFGWTMVCGVTAAGVHQCLGANGRYELGVDELDKSATPVNVVLPF